MDSHRVATVPELWSRWNEHWVTVSNSTVLNAKWPQVKPLLTGRYWCLSLNFADEHCYSTWVNCSVVIFSYESKFNLYHHDSCQVVHHRPGKEHLPKYIAPSVKYHSGGVMVWCLWGVLECWIPSLAHWTEPSQYSWWISGFLCTFYGLQADRFIFKEHNVPSHKDQIVMESKHNEGITMLSCIHIHCCWHSHGTDCVNEWHGWDSASSLGKDGELHLHEFELEHAYQGISWQLYMPHRVLNYIFRTHWMTYMYQLWNTEFIVFSCLNSVKILMSYF